MLGKSSDSNVEIVTIIIANVSDKVDAMYEASFDRFPLILALRRITSQGQDIATTMLLCLLFPHVRSTLLD